MSSNDIEQIVEISTGYEPRDLQQEIHAHMARFTVLAIHRRFGKTVCAINELIDAALTCPLHQPKVAYIAPYYKMAKSIAWEYLKTYTQTIPNSKAFESELKVDIQLGAKDGKKNFARIQLFGADHPDSLRGQYFDMVVFDEFGLMPISVWTEVVRPALADRHGLEGNITKALFLGTPNGKNHFYDIYMSAAKRMNEGHPDWYAATYRADETNVILASELESARENMPEEEFRQEFLCDWAAAVRGAFFAFEMGKLRDKKHITNVSHERNLPVYAAWDLGIDDYTAIWFFQCHRNEIRLIQYEEYTNVGMLDIVQEITRFGYVYASMIMPWDVNIREYTSGKTRLESMESLGFDVLVAPKLSVEDGVNAVRAIMSQCWFDSTACERGIDCLENYRKKYDNRTGQFLKTPVHDEFSHGADAFRYLACTWDESFGQAILHGNNHTPRALPKVRRSV